MFTGIIEATAKILDKNSNGILLERPRLFSELSIGQSIAVNGACLSVVEFSDDSMRFDVVPETFRCTNLGKANVVNLERAMPVNGRFEGHIVSGHVDGTLRLLRREQEGNGERFSFELPLDFRDFIVEKGSVTLNGVSLTIASVEEDGFMVALIPHTLGNTNLGTLPEGGQVNVELDVLVKYLRKWMQQREHS